MFAVQPDIDPAAAAMLLLPLLLGWNTGGAHPAARPRCPTRSCAGSARNRDPGTPSASSCGISAMSAFGVIGLAIVDDFARRRLVQLENGAPNGRLAAAGFAHQTQRFARVDGEGHVVHRLQRLGAEQARVDGKVLLSDPLTSSRGWLHLRFRHRALLLPP